MVDKSILTVLDNKECLRSGKWSKLHSLFYWWGRMSRLTLDSPSAICLLCLFSNVWNHMWKPFTYKVKQKQTNLWLPFYLCSSSLFTYLDSRRRVSSLLTSLYNRTCHVVHPHFGRGVNSSENFRLAVEISVLVTCFLSDPS